MNTFFLHFTFWIHFSYILHFEYIFLNILNTFRIHFSSVVSRWWKNSDSFLFRDSQSIPARLLRIRCGFAMVGPIQVHQLARRNFIFCLLFDSRKWRRTIQKRRSIARWLVLTCALAWRDISISVRKRFPTLKHLITAGLMTEKESQLFEEVVTPAATVKNPK